MNPLFVLIKHSTLFWFGLGALLCAAEFFLPAKLAKKYQLIPLISGILALVVALFSWRYSSIRVLNLKIFFVFRYQVFYWLVLSATCVLWVRPILLQSKRRPRVEQTTLQAKALTEIVPGETGRVLYEGVSWQACTEDEAEAIAPNQKVYVLRREGNTLIVASKELFRLDRS